MFNLINIKIKKIKKMTNYRRFSIASWDETYDPTTRTVVAIRVEKTLDYVRKFRKKYKRAVTIFHLVIKACAQAFKENPEANSILRFNYLYMRENVTVSASVVDKNGALITIRIEEAEKKSLLEIVDKIKEEVKKTRQQPDNVGPEAFFSKLPMFLLRPVLWVVCFVMFKLNIRLDFLGFPRDPFGVVEITYIGALGIEQAVLPLTRYTNVPFVVGPGVVKEVPVVENGQIKVGKVMNINFSFDHRYIDGFHGAKLLKRIKEILENPDEYLDPVTGYVNK